jgi:exodeoxyribonuclease V gamma subunit
VIQVTSSADLDVLSRHLAGILADPLDDPMEAEWIVVTTAGIQRWLGLQLARHLGSSGPDRTDGVAANLDMLFPGTFRRRLLTPDARHGDDPWHLDRLVWAVLDVIEGLDARSAARLGPLGHLAPGATRWGRARRVADLFDRYLLHRPAMLAAWTTGHDVDGSGAQLPERAAWQPVLWRLVHDRIGVPSPAERNAERLDQIRSGDVTHQIPGRVSLFGLSSIPGGEPFLELLEALGTQRAIHLLAHQPSSAMTRAVASRPTASSHHPVRRLDDGSASLVHHPLLVSWARPARESLTLLAPHIDPAVAGGSNETDDRDRHEPETLLQKIHHDLRTDTAPAHDFSPAPDDRSILIHSCHGATRQVEVLRDQILHLLANDPTLTEDDVVVLCPDLDAFAPLIEAVLGPPATSPGADLTSETLGAPTLSYRLTDRSLRATAPLLGALGALVELLDSRFSDVAVLDFANLGPVRARFGFDDDDLETLADWVEQANTRWGLDGDHRARWGIPAVHGAGSWRAAIDRLLLGVAVSDDPDALCVGDVLPIGVEGSDVAVTGRLADLLARLADLTDAAQHPRPIRAWVDLLQRATAELFAVDPAMAWQQTRLTHLLEGLAAAALVHAVPCQVDLTLADIRHLLGSELQGTAGRADFFRGGITISSLTPLRGVPHRVVCLLGMDETAFAAGSPDGDDLTGADPHLGDRDRKADTRQSLLETVLATRERLVVILSGHSVVTNRPIPAAVVVSELTDVVADTLAPGVRVAALARLTVTHPRQSFDERNFLPVGSPSSESQLEGPWSFDPLARAGATARTASIQEQPFLSEPLAEADCMVIALDDLRSFVTHPPKWFLRSVLEIRIPDNPSRSTGKLVAPTPGPSGLTRAAAGRELVLDLDGLERWGLRDRFLAHRRAGGDLDSFLRRERAADRLPPGRLAESELAKAEDIVEALIGALDALDSRDPSTEQRPIDITLPDGTRVVGSVAVQAVGHLGPVIPSVSTAHDRQLLAPWLDLMALSAHDPEHHWSSVLLTSASTKKRYQQRLLEIGVRDPARRRERALDALTVAVDLFRRGMREPLPIFPKLSPALHKHNTTSAWSPIMGPPGDSADKWIQVAFDHATLDEITSLPLRPHDPAGAGSDRARRYAHRLWGAKDASLAPDEEDGS